MLISSQTREITIYLCNKHQCIFLDYTNKQKIESLCKKNTLLFCDVIDWPVQFAQKAFAQKLSLQFTKCYRWPNE